MCVAQALMRATHVMPHAHLGRGRPEDRALATLSYYIILVYVILENAMSYNNSNNMLYCNIVL